MKERPRVVLVNRCFVIREIDSKLLIIKRSALDSHNPGKWEAPGGKVDEGQDLTRALEREVLEETWLVAEPTHRMVLVESYIIGRGRYKGMPCVALFHITRLVGGRLKLSGEHTDHAWVTYDEMLGYDLTLEMHKAAIYLELHLDEYLVRFGAGAS